MALWAYASSRRPCPALLTAAAPTLLRRCAVAVAVPQPASMVAGSQLSAGAQPTDAAAGPQPTAATSTAPLPHAAQTPAAAAASVAPPAQPAARPRQGSRGRAPKSSGGGGSGKGRLLQLRGLAQPVPRLKLGGGRGWGAGGGGGGSGSGGRAAGTHLGTGTSASRGEASGLAARPLSLEAADSAGAAWPSGTSPQLASSAIGSSATASSSGGGGNNSGQAGHPLQPLTPQQLAMSLWAVAGLLAASQNQLGASMAPLRLFRCKGKGQGAMEGKGGVRVGRGWTGGGGPGKGGARRFSRLLQMSALAAFVCVCDPSRECPPMALLKPTTSPPPMRKMCAHAVCDVCSVRAGPRRLPSRMQRLRQGLTPKGLPWLCGRTPPCK